MTSVRSSDACAVSCAAVQRLPDGRPRLNLKPRTVPAGEIGKPAPAAGKSSIFGGARPVDTAAREREIEERLRRGERGGRPRDRLSPQRRPPSGDDRRPPGRQGSQDRHDDRRPAGRQGSQDRHDDRRPPGRQGSQDRHDDRRPPGRQGSQDRHDDRRPLGRQSSEDRYDDRRPPAGRRGSGDDRGPGRHGSEDRDERRPPGRHGSEDHRDERRPPTGRHSSEDRHEEPRRREDEEEEEEEELSYKQRRAEAYRDIRFPDGAPNKKTESKKTPADSAAVSERGGSARGCRTQTVL